ncbi:MAG: LysE family translocator [Actinomycetota bacterium]|nr:LysE family translocator [Actinomycetota bacterium]
MNPSLMLAFWGVTLLLIGVPGPDWAFVLASGITDRTVVPAVGGLMVGYALLTAIVAAGVGAIVTERPVILTALTAIGAGYLVFLGTALLVKPSAIRSGPSDFRSAQWAARLAKGVGVSALNPKGLLIFLAMLPQFARPTGSWPVALQLAVLGLIFVLTCGVFYTVLGTSARAILRTRPGIASIVSRVSGAAMVVIGIALFIERLVALE